LFPACRAHRLVCERRNVSCTNLAVPSPTTLAVHQVVADRHCTSGFPLQEPALKTIFRRRHSTLSPISFVSAPDPSQAMEPFRVWLFFYRYLRVPYIIICPLVWSRHGSCISFYLFEGAEGYCRNVSVDSRLRPRLYRVRLLASSRL
jgi:hypothetical protein